MTRQSVPLAAASPVSSFASSKPAANLTRSNAALGSLSTPWTVSVTAKAGQKVVIEAMVVGYHSVDGICQVALAKGGNVLTKTNKNYVGGEPRTSETHLRWVDDNPSVGVNTYEVYAAAGGVITIMGGNAQDTTVSIGMAGNSVLTAEARDANLVGTIGPPGPTGPTGGGAPEVTEHVVYGAKGSDYSTAATAFGPIDDVNLPYKYITLAVGDKVECELMASGGNNTSDIALDFEVDRPTSANVRVGEAFGFGLMMVGGNASAVPINVKGVFTCTEAGSHGFRPVWKVDVGTGTLFNGGTGGNQHKAVPVQFRVRKAGLAGPQGPAGTATPAESAVVLTSETSTATAYSDLATVGPAVTVVVPASGKVWVELFGFLSSTGSNAASYMGVAVSGATTRAADDDRSIWDTQSAGFQTQQGGGFLMTGLTPGSTTFTAKYRVSGGTGTFKNRNMRVSPA